MQAGRQEYENLNTSSNFRAQNPYERKKDKEGKSYLCIHHKYNKLSLLINKSRLQRSLKVSRFRDFRFLQ